MKKLIIMGIAFVVGSLMMALVLVMPLIGTSFIVNSAAVTQPMPASYCVTGGGSLPRTVPEPMNAIFTEAANYYDVPPSVLAAVYYIENGQNYREPPPPYGSGGPWPTSHKGANGPFQFILGTWLMFGRSTPSGQFGNVNDLTDSAYAAAHYLSVLGATNSSPLGTPATRAERPSVMNALARYNAGESPDNWFNIETNDYLAIAERYLTPYYDGSIELGAEGASEPSSASSYCNIVPAEASKGYPNTDHLKCETGQDVGVFQTARGNKIRVCRLSNGLTVNASVEVQFQAIISEMAQRGYPLVVTDGFRTLNDQLDRRRVNCGSTLYDLWEKPNEQCSPPTAIPGDSRHEQGDAGDFAGFYFGSNKFIEMSKVAPKYGICNYPLEAWHWDTVNC